MSDNVIRRLLQLLHNVRKSHSNVLRTQLRLGQAIPVLVNHRLLLLVEVLRLLSTDLQLRHQHIIVHRLSLTLLRLQRLIMDQLCIEVLPLTTDQLCIEVLSLTTDLLLMQRFVRGLITHIR